MRLTKKRADNGRYYLSGLAEVLNSYPKGYGLIQVGHAVDKLAEYEDLEEQNRLIKLPCAVGDTVYVVMTYSGYVEEIVITGFSFVSNVIFMMCDEETGYREDLFGKTVFLTREEAEAALKELERGKGE